MARGRPQPQVIVVPAARRGFGFWGFFCGLGVLTFFGYVVYIHIDTIATVCVWVILVASALVFVVEVLPTVARWVRNLSVASREARQSRQASPAAQVRRRVTEPGATRVVDLAHEIEAQGWVRWSAGHVLRLVAEEPDPGNAPHSLTLWQPPAEYGPWRVVACTTGTPNGANTLDHHGIVVPGHHTSPVAALAQAAGIPEEVYRLKRVHT